MGALCKTPWLPLMLFFDFKQFPVLSDVEHLLVASISHSQAERKKTFRHMPLSVAEKTHSAHNEFMRDVRLLREGLQLDDACRSSRMAGWAGMAHKTAREIVKSVCEEAAPVSTPSAFHPARHARIVASEGHIPAHPQVLLLGAKVVLVVGGHRTRAAGGKRGVARLFYTTTHVAHTQDIFVLHTVNEALPRVVFSWASRPERVTVTKKKMLAIKELLVVSSNPLECGTEFHVELHGDASEAVLNAKLEEVALAVEKEFKAKAAEVADAPHLKDQATIAFTEFSFMSRGWTKEGQKVVQKALYLLLILHNKAFPDCTIELENATYVKAPSYFERFKGQAMRADGIYRDVQAKVYSKGVFQVIEEHHKIIKEGNKTIVPKLIKAINTLGQGFVETAPPPPPLPSGGASEP